MFSSAGQAIPDVGAGHFEVIVSHAFLPTIFVSWPLRNETGSPTSKGQGYRSRPYPGVFTGNVCPQQKVTLGCRVPGPQNFHHRLQILQAILKSHQSRFICQYLADL